MCRARNSSGWAANNMLFETIPRVIATQVFHGAFSAFVPLAKVQAGFEAQAAAMRREVDSMRAASTEPPPPPPSATSSAAATSSDRV